MYSIDRNCDIGLIFEIAENFPCFRKGKPRVTGGHKAAGSSPKTVPGSERTAGLPKKQSCPDIYLVRAKACFPKGKQAFFWEVNKEQQFQKKKR
jgi:hypothetical protein